MFNMDAEKLAKGAMQGLQKAEKLGGGTRGAAEAAVQAVKKMEKALEQLITALKSLLAEAKKLAAASGNKNEALSKCIEKAEKLLEGGDISTEAVTKMTAELGALIKEASGGAAKPAESGGTKAAAAAGAKPAAEAAKGKDEAPKGKDEAPKGKAVEFTDVDAGAYYYEPVQWAVQKGIASGTSETTFSPDKTCTYAQVITFLWRAAGSPAPKGQNNPFTDVKEGSYYYNAALWAAERGIVPGTAFTPDAAVTRSQVALFLYRNAGSPAVKSGASFKDVPGSADYSQAVAWVAERGITSGTKDGTFNPDAACTRGQIVTFLYRAGK